MRISEKQIDNIFAKSDKKEKLEYKHKDWIVKIGKEWRIRNPHLGVLLDSFKTRYMAKLSRLKYLKETNQL